MENQIEIIKNIADGMIRIGGIPCNKEFYAEFDMRVRAALRIHDVVGRSEQYCEHAVTDQKTLRCTCCEECGQILDVLD